MLDTFQGLPVHALIVHATVIVLPLAAISVATAALYPRFRAWAGPLPMIPALVSVVLVPLSTISGDKLAARFEQFGPQPLIEDHEKLAGLLIFLVIPFAALAVAGYLLHRRGASRAVLGAVAALSVASAAAVAVDVVLIGHAGATATYSETVKNTKP